MNVHFNPLPQLKTERCVLRELVPSDDEAILSLRSNDEVNQFIPREKMVSITQAQQFIDMINANVARNDSFYWGITLKNSDKLIGAICYWNILPEQDRAEIGYELHPDFQGKGIMQEVVSAVIEFGATQMKLKSILAFPSFKHDRSVHLLEKHSFKRAPEYDGTMHEEDLSTGMVAYVLYCKA